MTYRFNPGVDSIPEDRILFYNPNKRKGFRSIGDELVNVTDVDLLLNKLLDKAQTSILTQLEGYLKQALGYLQVSTTIVISIISVILAIYILELFTKYLFSKFF